MSDQFYGSKPEHILYDTLAMLGKQDGRDFTHRSPLLGGRHEYGGARLDFVFTNPPNLAICVNAAHPTYDVASAATGRDVIARQQMAGRGLKLIFVDEEDLLRDPEHCVREALAYRDVSRMRRT